MKDIVKIAMDYYDKLTKHFSEKYDMNKEDFSKHLANMQGYNSFDEMSDDEKHAAFKNYMAHLKI